MHHGEEYRVNAFFWKPRVYRYFWTVSKRGPNDTNMACFDFVGTWHRIHSTVIAIWPGSRIGYANVVCRAQHHIAPLQHEYAMWLFVIYRCTNSNAWAMRMKDVWAKATVHHRAHAREQLFGVHETSSKRFHAEYQPKRLSCIWNRMKFQWYIMIELIIWSLWPDCKHISYYILQWISSQVPLS